jgi:hypothetical protein
MANALMLRRKVKKTGPEVGRKNIAAIADQLIEQLKADDVTLAFRLERQVSRGNVCLLEFDQYRYRLEGYLSMSVLLSQQGEEQNADVVAFGALKGYLMTWTYERYEKQLSEKAADILTAMGFTREYSGSEEAEEE